MSVPQRLILLTPGPLTTTSETKRAMLRDWGSWDSAFNALTAGLCRQIIAIVSGEDTHVCIPLQGSGTFAVEAAIGTLVPKSGKVLIPVNGAYCRRIVRICEYVGRAHVTLESPEDECPSTARIEDMLSRDPAITHVAMVHCETGTGILNPLPQIAEITARHGRGLIVDAMSSFGALEIDARRIQFDAVIASSNKCLEGVPGMGFIIARKVALEQSKSNSHSLSMDLYDQWVYMQKTGQWRFTPPTHVVAALNEAMRQFNEEGGQPARGARYSRNCQVLIEEMATLGFVPFLHKEIQAPIIVTFHSPHDANFEFSTFYEKVQEKGYILYPGKLTTVDTFRVGCIGAIDDRDIKGAVEAVSNVLVEMNVKNMAPRESERTLA